MISGRGLVGIARVGGILFLGLCLSGCVLQEIKRQSVVISDLGVISGSVTNKSEEDGAIQVALIRVEGEFFEPMNNVLLSKSGEFRFDALPGDYYVGAFIDRNGDTEYQDGEFGTYLGIELDAPEKVGVIGRQKIDLDALVIKEPVKVESEINLRQGLSKAFRNIGKVVSLDAEVFSRENASIGLWRPMSFLDEQGGGLMMLQEFQQGKLPIVFVHGINGTAMEFSQVIFELDKTSFQPWVLQYPSGLSLDLISDYMVRALNQLNHQYKFPRVCIVAHSMGGLVVRSFVRKFDQAERDYDISMVVTINSPLYGMESAAKGVKSSPIVIPSWRDIATNSEFIQELTEWNWPEAIPYHLVFSYLPDNSGDGVVPLTSQLSLKLQDESTRIYGFTAEHTGILHDPEFIKRLNQILEDSF